jgi:SNF2 family DNA or RNA helicase
VQILTDELMEEIAASKDATSWLVLENHPDYPGAWLVQCLDNGFFYDFADIIGPYRTVRPSTLSRFTKRAEEGGYKIAFNQRPDDILRDYEELGKTPDVELNSSLGERGFLPYQVQGYNFLKDKSGVAMWSTGTGKTVLASALIKHHSNVNSFDFCFAVVKAHNQINTQRTLARLADIDSVVLDGPKKRREEMIVDLLQNPSGTVIITGYEKFRIDVSHLLPLFDKTRVLMIWDEMPTKLKSRNTKLYKSVRKLLYKKVNLAEQRPSWLRQYMLSATPIENGPEDFYNCARLIYPDVYGSIQKFRSDYVASTYFGNPTSWKNLDRMGMKAASFTHQVDKEAPDIAAQFPDVIEEPYYIDWNKEHRTMYEEIHAEAKRKVEDREILSESDVFGLLSVMQMMCSAPSMVRDSHGKTAEQLRDYYGEVITNDNFAKLAVLKDLLEDHAREKVVIFTAFNDALMPTLEDALQEWQVEYVRYNGTTAQKQTAQDYFCNEPNVQVFLSSDQGSDSISLEQASVVIHYDLPWKWSTYIQRQNRIHRVVSTHNKVRYYTLMMADSIEERRWKLLMKKKSYHDKVFKGEVADQSDSARMTREDLLYILG